MATRGPFPYWFALLPFLLWFASTGMAADLPMDDSLPLRMPAVGDHQVRVLSSNLLELTLITTKAPGSAAVTNWNFVETNGNATLPATTQFVVKVNGQTNRVQSVGFKRRPLYAPLKYRDLRIANELYLQLSNSVPTGASVQVLNPSATLWNTNTIFTVTADALRYSPILHVNQTGYMPGMPKKAMIGYYLGSLGEMVLTNYATFQLVNATNGNVVFTGNLTPRLDVGYTYTPTPYQRVREADFSSFTTPGEYKLFVSGLGSSFPFLIDDAVAANFARTYELGIYHQRCGTNNTLPYTRFTHGNCHTNQVEIPTMASPEAAFVNEVLNSESMGALDNPLHTAPRMTNIDASLYPFVNQGYIDASGGHHDAGDYSKYTINVAALVHYLVFAVDAFPGAKNLDNLGILESGDGISDLLQEAKWEADFLVKLQDADGGFYFIVYPRTRAYESNVLPDQGDLQLVLPKNTSGTAAAVAALAEIGSSPAFKAAYPAEASNYLQKALAGWSFLQNAIATYGRNGSYQMITQYGNEFMHNDELAWAAAALYAATGDPVYDNDLRTNTPNPNDSNLRRWGWWSMYEGYGCAYRTYAFAARTGRLQPAQLNSSYLAKCEAEIKFAASNAMLYSQHMAYGSSFSDENKPIMTAGWYFSGEQAFDLAVAYQINPQTNYLDVILKNFNYEMGCNPLNVSFLTGTGWRRQREIVHQYAQNDRRTLPPSGIPLGNIQQGPYYTSTYTTELGALTFPPDSVNTAPYPIYDRWTDAFNVMTEFVVSRQSGKMVSTASWLMAMTSYKTQTWNSASATITGTPAQTLVNQSVTANVSATSLSLNSARIVWEGLMQEPYLGPQFTIRPGNIGTNWVEVEAQLPDGRRVVAATNFFALPTNSFPPVITNSDIVALYRLNTNLADTMKKQSDLLIQGQAALDPIGLYCLGIGNGATVNINNTSLYNPTNTFAISLEAKLYINSFNSLGLGVAAMLTLNRSWHTQLNLSQDTWRPQPDLWGGTNIILSGITLTNTLTLHQWHQLNITLDPVGYTVTVDSNKVAQVASPDLTEWIGTGFDSLTVGNFDGWIRDVVIRNITKPPAPALTSIGFVLDTHYHLRINNGGSGPFVLEASTNLVNWIPIYTNNIGGQVDYADPLSPSYTRRFYRARNSSASGP
jgi:Glycosyl hydrolase family 9/Cellulase N-terminal ig-like domain